MSFPTLVSQLSQIVNLVELAKRLQGIKRKNTGMRRTFLNEVSLNYQLLTVLSLKKHEPSEQVIPRLKTTSFKKFLASDLSFELFQKRKVSENSVRGFPEIFSYRGKSTEILITSLYEKIFLLQECLMAIKKSEALKKKVRLDVRLNYLVKLHIVLLRHLSERL